MTKINKKDVDKMLQIILKLIAVIMLLIGVIVTHDARIITKRFFGARADACYNSHSKGPGRGLNHNKTKPVQHVFGCFRRNEEKNESV